MEIKKAIIPAAGLGTRFLPLTKVLPKELLPLVAAPMIKYIVEDAKDSGIEQVVFVLSQNKAAILDYFKKTLKLEALLEKRNQKGLLACLKKSWQDFEKITFSSVLQPLPRGDGDAVLRAKPKIGKSPFAVLFADDIFVAKTPALAQLTKVFRTSQKPVIGLKRVPPEKLSSYGIVAVEKIAHRLYKIKEVIEKPKPEEAPSDLAICGRFALSPDIFSYLEKTPPNKKEEIILAEAFKLMLKDGKIIYGYEIEGQWLECGKTIDWLKSNLYLCLRHPTYGPVLKEFLKKLK